MNGPVRGEILFSQHASVDLFECLIVAGAPATGILDEMSIKERSALQLTLQHLRDMWKNVDSMYVPRWDLRALHEMESRSCGDEHTQLPPAVNTDGRKLARYYLYLLFRYCVSKAGVTCYQGNQFLVPWEKEGTNRAVSQRLTDIPVYWMGADVCTNYPVVAAESLRSIHASDSATCPVVDDQQQQQLLQTSSSKHRCCHQLPGRDALGYKSQRSDVSQVPERQSSPFLAQQQARSKRQSIRGTLKKLYPDQTTSKPPPRKFIGGDGEPYNSDD